MLGNFYIDVSVHAVGMTAHVFRCAHVNEVTNFGNVDARENNCVAHFSFLF